MILFENRLEGAIPSQIGLLTSLSILDLEGQKIGLSGNLPPEIGNLQYLLGLFVSKNSLDGTIPTELGNCTSLEELYLDGNSFRQHSHRVGHFVWPARTAFA